MARRNMLRPIAVSMLLGLALITIAGNCRAQELEARAYSPNPIGARFVVVAGTHSDGDVLLDSSAPIEDFEISADSLALGLGGTFAIGDRLASAGIGVPWMDARATGLVNGVPERADRNGPGDLRLRLSISLLPDSAQDMAAFSKAPPDRTLGASLLIVAPTGEYFEDRLVNIGTNRWALKPEIGGFRRVGRWGFDGSLGVWFFEDNDAFFGGHVREQDPLFSAQGHVSYTFSPRLWLGAGATWYAGGRTVVDGKSDRNTQDNSRAGVTLAVPLGRSQSIKLAWSAGVTARFGGDVETWSLSWQYFWFD